MGRKSRLSRVETHWIVISSRVFSHHDSFARYSSHGRSLQWAGHLLGPRRHIRLLIVQIIKSPSQVPIHPFTQFYKFDISGVCLNINYPTTDFIFAVPHWWYCIPWNISRNGWFYPHIIPHLLININLPIAIPWLCLCVNIYVYIYIIYYIYIYIYIIAILNAFPRIQGPAPKNMRVLWYIYTYIYNGCK